MRLLLLWLIFGPDVYALGCDDYAAREAAEARLSRWADVCYPLLSRPFADPERARRARRITALVVPGDCPPLTLLCGTPMPEWQRVRPLDGVLWATIGARPRTAGWELAWLRPDAVRQPWWEALRYGQWRGWLLWHYHERCRTQGLWPDWHSVADGRAATRLLCRDLLAVGCPPCLVRCLLLELRQRELALLR